MLIALVGAVIGAPPAASATGNDYPWRTANSGAISPLGFYYRNCTDFAAWRLNTQVGVRSAPWRFAWSNLAGPGGNGHAVGWKDGAISRGYRVDNVAQVGAVAWWGASRGGGFGHVAIVTAVNPDGSANIEQYNATPYAYSTQNNVRAEKYLHIADQLVRDAFFVKTRNTGSGRVEVHTATAATGYQHADLHSTTWFGTGDQSNGWFQIGAK